MPLGTVHIYIHKYEYISQISHGCVMTYVLIYAEQKHLWCKKVRGQSEATLQTGRRDQKD